MEKRTLEDRIRAIEDRLEIYNLIAGHPPSADTGADYFTRAVYVEDGELDLGRGKAMRDSTQPPKMSPLALVSAGMALMRTVSAPRGFSVM